MSEEDNNESTDDEGILGEDDIDWEPPEITLVNSWLDAATTCGSDVKVIRNDVFTARQLAAHAVITVGEASQMLQRYRDFNYRNHPACMYVIAHEGHYGAEAPWRLLGTFYALPESTIRIYRLNQARHMTWEIYDHTRKEIKSFGAEVRQSLVMNDSFTTTIASGKQRLAVRDYARDLLHTGKMAAQTRAQNALDSLGIPRRQRDAYLMYFFNGFWPYVQVMMDAELDLLNAMVLPPPPPPVTVKP